MFRGLYKNWVVHNLFAHPLSEIAYWTLGENWSGWIHDITIPDHKSGTGRG